jgi:hypothetical protein
LPGWLAEEPRVTEALARIVVASPSPGPKLRGHIVKCFECFADGMELTHRRRAWPIASGPVMGYRGGPSPMYG